MSLRLFYDTETTGLPLFDQPSEDPRQPHIVQLAAVLVDIDNDYRRVSEFNLTVRPDGWEIPQDVSAIHGITTERALAIGVPEKDAVTLLTSLWVLDGCIRVAHNESFDARIVRIALKRYFDPAFKELATPPSDAWKQGAAECTARMATPMMNLPPTERMRAAGRNHAKTPNLGEAYQHFTGNALDGAHDAMVDVNACIAIYRAMTKTTEKAQ